MKQFFTVLLILANSLLFAQEETVVEPTASEPYGIAVLDVVPEFPGGTNAFGKAVIQGLKIPDIDKDISVRTYVNFVINEDGTMSDITYTRDPGYGLGEEAVKAVKAIKTKWSPGIYRGRPVRVKYAIPIVINVKGDIPKKQ